MFAKVVFPLPFRNSFTYAIPGELEDLVQVGVRVVVPFGKRIMTGFVIDVSEETDVETKIKKVQDVLDEQPIFNKESLKFYEWIAEYYLSSLGEALRNSVPYGTDVETKRKIVSDTDYCKELLEKESKKTSVKGKILQVLSERESVSISFLQKLIKKKNIYSSLRSLESQGALTVLDKIDDAKVRIKKVKYVKLAKDIDEIYELIPSVEARSPKQVVILLELLSNKNEPFQLSELLKKTQTHQSSINSLVEKGAVVVFDKEVERIYKEEYNEDLKEFTTTEQQQKVVTVVKEKIEAEQFDSFLLHGVTGSGKTHVYIELTKSALDKGKTVLILVPEISLTPQITSRFFNTFGETVAVIHSRLTLGERYDTWRGIVKGKFKVVIGPRSALFAPLKNIGLIVVDEEHDSSYKQNDLVPRYHGRDAAIVRAHNFNCPVLLGSATPSIESKFNAVTGKYKFLELTERIDKAKMPRITLVDITQEKKKKRMKNIFSDTLLEKINDRIQKKQGVIILQNRRGFATQVFCDDCGEIISCPDCSVGMVHHLSKNILQCHYCGRTTPVPKACTTCGSISLRFWGTGTQRVEDELAYHFPDIRMERVDSDTMNKRGQLSFILNSFRKGEIDLLVGTQMVSKGLDFSHVTLVGVISAETSLWMPDFRADERTFQLLTQVAGRSGRSEVEGEVIIQTQSAQNFVLQRVVRNDYAGFYAREIFNRQRSGYPPFTKMALIEFKNDEESAVQGAARDFFNFLQKYKNKLNIVPPAEAVIYKIKGYYRYHLLVRTHREKDPNGRILRNSVLETFIEFNKSSRYRDVKVIIDIDPQDVL